MIIRRIDLVPDKNPDQYIHPVQRRIYQSMAPARKLEVALSLYHSARELKAAALRTRYPDLPENEIQAKVKEIFLYART